MKINLALLSHAEWLEKEGLPEKAKACRKQAYENNNFVDAQNVCNKFPITFSDKLNNYDKFFFPKYNFQITDLDKLITQCNDILLKLIEQENSKRKDYDDYVKWKKLNTVLLETMNNLPQIKNDSELSEASESLFINSSSEE